MNLNTLVALLTHTLVASSNHSEDLHSSVTDTAAVPTIQQLRTDSCPQLAEAAVPIGTVTQFFRIFIHCLPTNGASHKCFRRCANKIAQISPIGQLLGSVMFTPCKQAFSPSRNSHRMRSGRFEWVKSMLCHDEWSTPAHNFKPETSTLPSKTKLKWYWLCSSV